MSNTLRLAMLAACWLLVSPFAPAQASGIDRRCAVFSGAQERAQCACAVEHGAWVTAVQGRWRVVYPRRHVERHCHGQLRALGAGASHP